MGKQRRNKSRGRSNQVYTNWSRKITGVNFNAGTKKLIWSPIFEVSGEYADAAQAQNAYVGGDLIMQFTSMKVKAEFLAVPGAGAYVLPPYEAGLVLITTTGSLTLYQSYEDNAQQDLDLSIRGFLGTDVPYVYKVKSTPMKCFQVTDAKEYRKGTVTWEIPKPLVSSLEAYSTPRVYQYLCAWMCFEAAANNCTAHATVQLTEGLSYYKSKQSKLVIKEVH